MSAAAPRTLIRGAHVVSMDPAIGDLARGDVLVTGDRIEAVGAGPITGSGDVERVIDARGKLLIPGLVDTHLHLWQTPVRGMTSELWSREYFNIVHPMSRYYDPEDMYWASRAGALELIDHGVTSVFDYCHSTNSPEHARASLTGLRDAGIRGRFGFGMFERDGATYRDRAHRLTDLAELNAERKTRGDLLELAVAVDHDVKVDAVECARGLGLPISVHGNPVGLVEEYRAAGLLGPDMLWVHCNYASDAELAALADAGATLALTPDIEMGMGKPVAIFERAVRHRIPVCLGVDVVSYGCADLLTQMRLAYALQRVLDGQAERDAGHVPPQRTPDRPALRARDVLEWATIHGARALGLGAEIGSVTPGKRADLVLIETEPFGMSMGDPAAHVVLQTTAADIDTVMIGGAIRKADRRLVDVDAAQLSAQLYASRERLLSRRESAAPAAGRP